MTLSRLVSSLCAGLAAAALWAAPAAAQLIDLATLPNQSPLQTSTGAAVDVLCPNLAMMGAMNPAQGDLLNRCSELKLASDPLGLGVDGRNRALLQISHDEDVLGASSTRTQAPPARSVTGRLGALRSGATGISLSGLDLYRDGERIALGDFMPGREDSASGSPEAWPSRLGVFAHGSFGFGDRDEKSEELGFRFISGGITTGADWRFTEEIVAGAALGWRKTHSDFKADPSELEQDVFSGTVYGSWYRGDFYVDGVASYGYHEFDLDRSIQYATFDRTARGSTHANEVSLGAGTGYDFHHEGWTFGPRARFDYTRLEIDSFEESGAQGLNLSYEDQTIRSVATTLGLQASYALSTSFGVLLPQIRVDWEHEFQDDAQKVTARYSADPLGTPFVLHTDAPDRDFVNLGVGVVATLQGGVSAFADFSTLLGLQDTQSYAFTVGGRWEF